MSNHARRRNWFRRRPGWAERGPQWPTEPSELVMHGVCVACGKRGLITKATRVCFEPRVRVEPEKLASFGDIWQQEEHEPDIGTSYCQRVQNKKAERMLHAKDGTTAE